MRLKARRRVSKRFGARASVGAKSVVETCNISARCKAGGNGGCQVTVNILPRTYVYGTFSRPYGKQANNSIVVSSGACRGGWRRPSDVVGAVLWADNYSLVTPSPACPPNSVKATLKRCRHELCPDGSRAHYSLHHTLTLVTEY